MGKLSTRPDAVLMRILFPGRRCMSFMVRRTCCHECMYYLEFLSQGIGENIRGTTLGAIDSLGNQGNTRHEDIARKGRLETEQAITTLKGQPVTSGVEGHDAAQASGVTGSAGAQGQGDQPHPEEKSEAGVGQPAQPYQSSSMSRDQGGPGAAAGVGGGSGGSESYHYRDYPVTNNNVIQGEQKSGTSQLSSADQKQAPSYDPNTAGDRQ